jgi:NitT/TauT family transport system permease protein
MRFGLTLERLISHVNKLVIARTGLLLAIIFLWETLGRANTSTSFFISKPTEVVSAFASLLFNGNLLYHFLITASEAFIGLSLGTIVGAAIGLFLWYSRFIARTLQPFILVAGTIPLVAFAPLFIVWFGIGYQMKAALAFFSTVFPALSQSYRGALSVSVDYSDVLEAMHASPQSIFRKVIIPGSFDSVLGSMRLNIGFGILGAFLGEFIASQAGLGYIVLRSSSLYNIPQALAAALSIGILALVFDRAGSFIESKKIEIIQIISVPRILWYRNKS